MLKQALNFTKHLCRQALATPPLYSVTRTLLGGQGAILMFHRCVPADSSPRIGIHPYLEVSPHLLKEIVSLCRRDGFEIVPIGDVPERLQHTTSKPFVVITFDDGYRDNLTVAAPLLDELKAPFTVYLATDFIDHNTRLWWYDLEQLLLQNEVLTIETPEGPQQWTCRTPQEKLAAFAAIRQWLIESPQASQRLDWLYASHSIDPRERVDALVMNWDEARTLARLPGVTIGAHGVSHQALSRLSDSDMKNEIQQSKDILEAKLSQPITHFCYPFGSPAECAQREFEAAQSLGFETAVTTREGLLAPHHLNHLTRLPRLHVNGLWTAKQHRLKLSGWQAFRQNRSAEASS